MDLLRNIILIPQHFVNGKENKNLARIETARAFAEFETAYIRHAVMTDLETDS